MKQTIDINDFHNAFRNMGRIDQFSYHGREALFEFLTQYESDCGTEIELDIVALCCDYTEDTIGNILENYELDSIDDLNDRTITIMVDDSSDDIRNHIVIYQVF